MRHGGVSDICGRGMSAYTQPCCNEASALSSGLFTYTHHQPACAYATSESERGRSQHDASWSSQVAKVHIHIHIFFFSMLSAVSRVFETCLLIKIQAPFTGHHHVRHTDVQR